MTDATPHPTQIQLNLPSEDATTRLASRLSPMLSAGDVLLINGPIGAGKTHLCRSLIQSRLAAEGRMEDVPSPTYTLVQVYELDGVEIWHADLYRLTDPAEVLELGLGDAFDTAICLVEWPDRLGPDQPPKALQLNMAVGEHNNSRVVTISASNPRWAPVFAEIEAFRITLA